MPDLDLAFEYTDRDGFTVRVHIDDDGKFHKAECDISGGSRDVWQQISVDLVVADLVLLVENATRLSALIVEQRGIVDSCTAAINDDATRIQSHLLTPRHGTQPVVVAGIRRQAE